MRNSFVYYILAIFFITTTFSANAEVFDGRGKKFEGYQIKFDYEKYPKEREIAYQYYLDEESKYLPNIPKEKIGIDLYDIDGDGKKEILDGTDRFGSKYSEYFAGFEKTPSGSEYKIDYSTAALQAAYDQAHPENAVKAQPKEAMGVRASAENSYKVQAGDNLSSIAAKNNMSLEQLLSLSENFRANPDSIKPGN